MTVYVVAWQYNTGSGFDWYATPEAADKAFAVEQENTSDPQLAAENWTAYRFNYEPNGISEQEIKSELEDRLDLLCEGKLGSVTVTGPGFRAINAALEA